MTEDAGEGSPSRLRARSFSTPENERNLRASLAVLRDQTSSLSGEYPIIYHLDITGRCNLSCLYCQRDFFLATKHPFLKGEMSEDVFQALLPYFRHAKLVALLSMLGEPLMVKALPRWWAAVSEAGAKPQTTTNGSFLTPELAEFFTGTGGRLKISIDTFEQSVLSVLRPRMEADLLRDRLRLIEHHRRPDSNRRFELGVNICATSRNLHSVVATMEECIRLARVDVFTLASFRLPRDEIGRYHEDARFLSLDLDGREAREAWRGILTWAAARAKSDGISFVFPYSRAEWQRLLGDEAAALYESQFEERDSLDADGRYYCCVPWLKVHVLADGSVIPCHLLQWADPSLVLGNVLETSFDRIWNGEKYVAFREDMSKGRRLEYCGQCRSWWRFYAPQRVE